MLVTPDQDQLNLGLLVVGACLVLLAIVWRLRRSRSARKQRAATTEPIITNAAPVSDFTTLYDEALVKPEAPEAPVENAPSGDDPADPYNDSDPAPCEATPENRTAPAMAKANGAAALNDFRRALNDGLDLPSAARKHGLTEDEARVASLCYSPPDA